jgi:hypothetical protein
METEKIVIISKLLFTQTTQSSLIYIFLIPKHCEKSSNGWKPTHQTFVFALWTSVSPPDGTTLTALIQMLNTDGTDGWFPPTHERLCP